MGIVFTNLQKVRVHSASTFEEVYKSSGMATSSRPRPRTLDDMSARSCGNSVGLWEARHRCAIADGNLSCFARNAGGAAKAGEDQVRSYHPAGFLA